MTRAAAAYLRELLAAHGGSLTVERFMQEALYHPEFGYYAQNVRTVGAQGDFSTSPTLCPALGQAIARWLAAHQTGGWFAPWHVIELGAGTGQLAAGTLAALGLSGRRGLHYHIVEISARLRTAQRSRLRRRRVAWHGDLASALDAAGGHALIFSNEFADAFPCRQLAWNAGAGRWHEVRVRWTPEGLRSFGSSHPCAETRAGTVDGQRIEKQRSYGRWMAGWAPRWRAGRMLTIDYGGAWPALYDQRPRGTLRAYWRHQRLEGDDVFARFGQQDLTADVNFTDLAGWGARLGWGAGPLGTQADFLRAWLPAAALRDAASDPLLRFLLDPAGAGGAFKTLEQWPAGFAGAEADSSVDLFCP